MDFIENLKGRPVERKRAVQKKEKGGRTDLSQDVKMADAREIALTTSRGLVLLQGPVLPFGSLATTAANPLVSTAWPMALRPSLTTGLPLSRTNSVHHSDIENLDQPFQSVKSSRSE